MNVDLKKSRMSPPRQKGGDNKQRQTLGIEMIEI